MALPTSKPGRDNGGLSRPPAAMSKKAAHTKGPGHTAQQRGYTIVYGAKTERVATLAGAFRFARNLSRRRGRTLELVFGISPDEDPTISVRESTPQHPAIETAPADSDLDAALAAARARGHRRVAEILSGDDMLSADALASLLGTSRVTVNAKRQRREILGLEGAKRGYRFPQWQVGDDGKPFAALPALFERLGDSPWAVYRFLVQHHPELGGITGREALQRGRTAETIEAAESVARDFA